MSIATVVELKSSGYQNLPSEFDPEDQGLIYGSTIAYVVEQLDNYAMDAAVTPISDFLIHSDLLEDHGSEHNPVPWTPVLAGRQTVRALIDRLASEDADAQIGQSLIKDVLWDLNAYAAILDTSDSQDAFVLSAG